MTIHPAEPAGAPAPSSLQDPSSHSSLPSFVSRDRDRRSATSVGVWFWAVIWTFSSALAGVLWRGIRHGDWSAFRRYEFPEDDGERFDWSTRTGRYAWCRDYEEGGHEGEGFHDHGPIT